MGKKCLQNLAPSLILFLALAVFRFKYPFWLLFFGLGGLLGSFILEIEGIIYCVYLEPEEQISKEVSQLISARRYRNAMMTVALRRAEIKTRVFHTFLFQVIFAVLTWYVLTSTGSAFACGLSLFAYLHLLKDQVTDSTKGNLNGWGGFFGLSVPLRWQKAWVGAGVLVLLYFFYLLVR